MRDRKLIISCEHADNAIPQDYRHLFEKHREVLQTHRGWDIGALEIAQRLSKRMDRKPHINTRSRLLIDLNRSLHHPAVFSEFMDDVSREDRQSIIEKYYVSYRQKIEQEIEASVQMGQSVLHLSVHTFTPVLSNKVRDADIAFLYDPQRAAEKQFCRQWRKNLQNRLPELKYRMNYPYRGVMDGFTTALRKKFSAQNYCGIELEVNQKFAEPGAEKRWHFIQHKIAGALEETLSDD